MGDLYESSGIYRYRGGLNWVALAAMFMGIAVRPFTPAEAVPTLVSFLAMGLSYVVLMRVFWPGHFSRPPAPLPIPPQPEP